MTHRHLPPVPTNNRCVCNTRQNRRRQTNGRASSQRIKTTDSEEKRKEEKPSDRQRRSLHGARTRRDGPAGWAFRAAAIVYSKQEPSRSPKRILGGAHTRAFQLCASRPAAARQ